MVKKTHIISSESNGAHPSQIFFHFHSSERSSSLQPSEGRRTGLSPRPQPPSSLCFASQSLPSYLHNTVRIDQKKASSRCVHPTEGLGEGCHKSQIDHFVVFLKDRTTVQKSPIEIGRCREPQHARLDHAWVCKIVLQSFQNIRFLRIDGEFTKPTRGHSRALSHTQFAAP